MSDPVVVGRIEMGRGVPSKLRWEPEPKFCRKCGTELAVQVVETAFFRTDTGERETVRLKFCPTCSPTKKAEK